MKTNHELVGKEARLPDGQKVVIEEMLENDRAVVRRVDGERAGTVAVCKISFLKFAQRCPTPVLEESRW